MNDYGSESEVHLITFKQEIVATNTYEKKEPIKKPAKKKKKK